MVKWNTRKEYVERYGIEKYILRCIKNRERLRKKLGYKGKKVGRSIKWDMVLLNDTEKLRRLEKEILESESESCVNRDNFVPTTETRCELSHNEIGHCRVYYDMEKGQHKGTEDGKNEK